MLYAKINNIGEIISYPVNPRLEHNNTSFPKFWIGGIIEDDHYVLITEVPKPLFNPLLEKVVEITPILSSNTYIQQWSVEPFTTEELATQLLEKRKQMQVSPLQAKGALYLSGLLDSVQSVIDSANTDPLIVLAWNHALEFKRLSPAIINLSNILGWTDEQLDELFEVAKTIEV